MIVYRGFQGLLVRLMSMHTAATSLLEFIVVQVTGQIIGSVIYIQPQQKHAGFLRCVLFLYKLKIAATVKLSIGQGFIAGRYYLLKGFFHMMVYTHFVQLVHFVILNDFPFIITTTTTIQPFFQASWGRLEMKPERNNIAFHRVNTCLQILNFSSRTLYWASCKRKKSFIHAVTNLHRNCIMA